MKPFAVAGALLLALVSAFAGTATLSADHSWDGYHWARTANPFTLSLGDNVTGAWDSYLREASTDWSASSVLNTTVVSGGLKNVKQCSPLAGRVDVCNSKYGFNGWLGVAGIYITGGHITRAYVKLNDSYFNTPSYNTPAWRRLVMCQEVGHAFGLDHQDEEFSGTNLGTCMDYTSDPDGPPSNEHPNAHDYAQLEAIYAHLDSTTTVGATTPTGPGRNGVAGTARAPGLDEHGLPAHASRANGDVYATDLGNGERLIVHVFWIPRGLPGAR